MASRKYYRDPLTIRLPTNGTGKWHDGMAAATLLAHPLAGDAIQMLHLDAGAKEHTIIVGVAQRAYPPSVPDEESDRAYTRELVLRVWRGSLAEPRGIDTDVLASSGV